MARTDLGTARAVKRHAVFARVDVADIDRRIEPGAARDGGVQIAKGHPARVGGIIAETDQRMASLDPVALQHRGGFEKLRSEEHTSELQSLMRISYAVFCLKKKNKNRTEQTQIRNTNA